MSFIVVNTGRAASRAIYLNLRGQPGLHVPSRTHFDDVVTAAIAESDLRPLEQLDRTRPEGATGIVFHGVRPRLAHPFTAPENVELLRAVGDRLELSTAFLVVRDPAEVFHSELNRLLAGAVGDWTFPDGYAGWRSEYTPQELGHLPNPSGAALDPQSEALERSWNGTSISFDPIAVAQDVSLRTGRAGALLELFSAAFSDVRVIAYRALLEDPASVYRCLTGAAGVDFVDGALAEAKLNSLANRLLIYNPIRVRFASGVVRYRFELSQAIRRCEDWGTQDVAVADCTAQLEPVVEDLRGPLGLGVVIDDLAGLAARDRAVAVGAGFLDDLVGAVAPVFAQNYRFARGFYRDRVYLSEAPAAALDAFARRTADDRRRLDELAGAGVGS